MLVYDQARAGSWGHSPGFLCGWQKPSPLSRLPPRVCVSSEAGLGAGAGDQTPVFPCGTLESQPLGQTPCLLLTVKQTHRPWIWVITFLKLELSNCQAISDLAHLPLLSSKDNLQLQGVRSRSELGLHSATWTFIKLVKVTASVFRGLKCSKLLTGTVNLFEY